jgi:uncharacterized protein (UPF0303 family)
MAKPDSNGRFFYPMRFSNVANIDRKPGFFVALDGKCAGSPDFLKRAKSAFRRTITSKLESPASGRHRKTRSSERVA